MTSTVRLCFGMARDNQLPFSKPLAEGQPAAAHADRACIGVALLAAIPFLQFTGATIIAVAATAMIYLSYFLGNMAVMRARTRGWPKADAPFKLGAWGKPSTSWRSLWGGAMLVNFLWWTNDPDCRFGSSRTRRRPRPTRPDRPL